MSNQAGFISRILTIAMAAIIFIGGLFYARHAHQGQVLYPMRILGEEIEYVLIPSEEEKINFRIEQLNDLSFEIRKDIQTGNFEEADQQSEELSKKSQELQNRVDNLAKEGKDTTNLNQSLKAIEQGQACTQSQIEGSPKQTQSLTQ